MIFENQDTKYTLGQNWVLRKDVNYTEKYSVYNINNRTVLYISASLYSFLKLFDFNAISHNEITAWFSRNNLQFDWIGFYNMYRKIHPTSLLVESKVPFGRIDACIENQDKTYKIPIASTPFDIEMHFTHKCNLKCLHCFQESSPASLKFKELTTSEWLDIFDKFEKNKVQSIVITGGEPLLYKNFIEVFNIIVKKKINYTVLTNATLINLDTLDSLAAPNVLLSISLDGYTSAIHDILRGKGAFDKVVHSIRLLVAKGANVNLSSVIHKRSHKSMRELVLFAYGLGVKGITFAFMDLLGRAKDNKWLELSPEETEEAIVMFSELKKDLRHLINIDFSDLSSPNSITNVTTDCIYCSAGTIRIAVSSDGMVYPCVHAFGHEELIVGNLKEQSLQEIWNDEERWRLFRGEIKLEEIDTCNKCSLRNECSQKNCRLKSYHDSKSLYAKPVSCLLDRTVSHS